MDDSLKEDRTDNRPVRALKALLHDLARSQFFRHFLLAVLVVGMVFVGITILNRQGTERAYRWLGIECNGVRECGSKLREVKTLEFGAAFDCASAEQKDRLQRQYKTIRDRASTHLEVMVFFYSRFYMSITLAAISGLVAAIALVFVTRSGWARTSTYVLTILVIAAAAAACFGSFPAVFKQRQNIDDNRIRYIAHAALEQRLLSYVATGENIKGEQMDLASFIHEIDSELEEWHDLPLEFDPGAIPESPNLEDLPQTSD